MHCRNNFKIKYQNCRKRQIDTTNPQMHDRALFWLGTDTSIKSGVVKLVLWLIMALRFGIFIRYIYY
jgi:hypothetical protein